MYTLNLAQLPMVTSVDFLLWISDHNIGNWQSLLELIFSDDTWYRKETIPFECSEEEAVMIMLRWS